MWYVFEMLLLSTLVERRPQNPYHFTPELSDAMKTKIRNRRLYLLNRRNNYVRVVDKLEPVATAMERDGSDDRHIPLSQVFIEEIRHAKEEIRKIDEKVLWDHGWADLRTLNKPDQDELGSLKVLAVWFNC